MREEVYRGFQNKFPIHSLAKHMPVSRKNCLFRVFEIYSEETRVNYGGLLTAQSLWASEACFSEPGSERVNAFVV